MRRLLLITSAAALLAVPAIAQDDAVPSPDATVDSATTLESDETLRDADADGSLETLKNGYTDQHVYVGTIVMSEGDVIGEIERVHFTGNEVDRIVIEAGGIGDLGGREVEMNLVDGSLTYNLNISREDFNALPAFDEAEASDFPLSDNPLEDLDDDETPAEESTAEE